MNDSCPYVQFIRVAAIVQTGWLFLFCKNKCLRTISNRFLASLSIADFFVGLIIDLVWIFIGWFVRPAVPTSVYYFTQMLWVHTTAVTALNISCVSVDRFIAIRFAFRYQDIVTKKRCYRVIILVWFISSCLPFSTLLADETQFSVKEDENTNSAVL